MTPIPFPEANGSHKAPESLDESQVLTASTYTGYVQGGSLDGAPLVVVAWMPSTEELHDLIGGKPIYLSVLGGLPPHYISTSFKDVTNFQ